MPATATRRCDRICLTLLLEISGTGRDGKPFTAPAHTLMVSRKGAVIVCDRKLYEDQRIQVRRTAKTESRRRGMARVLGQYGRQGDASLYAIECVDGVDLWTVDFPELATSEEAVARILLECSSCRQRETVYLDSVQLQEYETNQAIARHCKACGRPRIWTQAAQEKVTARAVSTRSDNIRMKTHLTACVRQADMDDDLAVCEEVSSDGLTFRSHRRYAEGTEIAIAAPYADATENIFISARVLRAEDTLTGFFRHETEYVNGVTENSSEEVQAAET